MSAQSTTTRPRGGRPKKDAAERRSQQQKVRWTIDEERRLMANAQAAGLSVAEFIRRRALHIPVVPPAPKTDAQLLHELNAIGVNLNNKLRSELTGRTDRTGLDWTDLYGRIGQLLDRAAEAFR